MKSTIALARGGPAALMLATALFAAPALAQSTVWTDWTSRTVGSPGAAAGLLDGVAVSYSGEVLANTVINGSSAIWLPATSFIGGTSTTSPSSVGDAITLSGSFSGLATITFASAVTNPVFAIWSLGSPRLAASFTFNTTPTLQAGGPNANFGGSAISVAGNTVSGSEGNGVVQFDGIFDSISWTSTFENFYAFSVGVSGSGLPPPVSPIPEPGTAVLLGVGLATLAGIARRRRRA